jgi:hypothetical protein
MQAVISMRARGKGAFALRRDLKAAKDTVYELKRFQENEHGTHLQLDDKLPTMLPAVSALETDHTSH